MNTNIQEIKAKALEIFRNNEMDEAIDYLLENLDNKNEIRNQLIILSSRSNMLEKERDANFISKKKYIWARNRIYSVFPEIVDSLDKPYDDEEIDTYSPEPYYISSNYSSTYTPNESLLISIIVLLILIVIGIIFIIFKLN